MTSLTTLDDSVLIARTLAGQSECFTVLMNRHMDAVRRRVNSMVRNPPDTDDLVQETFLKAWLHLASFRSDSSFRTWITRVAINEVLQHYRKERSSRVGPAVASLDDYASHEESPHEALVRSKAFQTIRGAVAALPRKYRQILILRDLDELTTQETASRLRFGPPLIKTRLFRARQMLSTAVLRSRAA